MLHRVTTKYVCGVDLHAKTLTGVIMDLEGKIHRKGTVPCELPRLMELLGPYAGDVTVGVESTYNWYWLIDALHRVDASGNRNTTQGHFEWTRGTPCEFWGSAEGPVPATPHWLHKRADLTRRTSRW